jgi:hypothetical protein
MHVPNAAARRLLVLCGLVPLLELTQQEVDALFRRLVEDAGPPVETDDHPGASGTPAEQAGVWAA